MAARYLLSSLVVTSASLLTTRITEPELPKVTHKVFFDVQDGERDLGRSMYYIRSFHFSAHVLFVTVRLTLLFPL